MAAKSRSEIIGDIEDYIARNGASYGEWYVGFTGNPKTRLFGKHKLREKGDAWVCRLSKDEYEAHEVVDYFRNTRRTKAAPGQPADADLYVYAYRMKPHTSP
ncbi:MAG: hypothetical protein HYU60_00755 [Magnetospirillum sp.]|nr:hypothetical protein [Magnetospirillum sp.]